MALLLTLPVSAQETEEFKPSGKLSGLLFANFHATFSGGKNLTSFEVNRAFLGYEHSFSKTFTARLLYDGSARVYSGRSMITGYLRNAYIQFDNGRINIRGGLITPEQILILEKFWTYRYLFPPYIERAGMAFSSEPGVSFKYKPSDNTAIDFSVLNGRGFRDILPDTTLRVTAGVSLNPFHGVSLRCYADGMGLNGNMQQTFGALAAYRGKNFYIGTECLFQRNHLRYEGNNYSAVSLFASLILKSGSSLFTRYENISSSVMPGESEPWNIEKDGNTIVAGFEYIPARNVRFAPIINCSFPADKNTDPVIYAEVNMEAAF